MEGAIKKYGDKDVRWSAQGMLRLMPAAMQRLYRPTLDAISDAISRILNDNNMHGTAIPASAAVLVDRVTVLARPSVRLYVRTSKPRTKKCRKKQNRSDRSNCHASFLLRFAEMNKLSHEKVTSE